MTEEKDKEEATADSPNRFQASPSSVPSSVYSKWLPKPDGVTDPRTLPLCLPPSALSSLSSFCPLPSDVFSLVRQWAAIQREKLCPPSSYSSLTRSSLTLIDASACIGFAGLTLLRRADVWNRLIALEQNDEWADALSVNAACYSKADKVTIKRKHVMQYFQKDYPHEAKFSCIYWDPSVPSSPSLSLTQRSDDFQFDKPLVVTPSLSFLTLSDCVRHLLSHPLHPVPLLLLKLPSSFQTSHLSSLARHSVEEPAIAKRYGYTFLILSGSSSPPSLSSSSLTPTPPYPDHPHIPLASSRRQLSYLHSVRSTPLSHLYQRLKQIMASQLWGCPQAQTALWRFFNEQMEGGESDDEVLYDRLRAFYHQRLLPTPECAEIRKRKQGGGEGGEGRANSRVKELVDIIRQHAFPSSLPSSPSSLLDIGCSEGSITASLASALSISPASAHGCDVRELPSSPLFTFTLITSSTLPYPSSSLQLALCLMSLHHIDTCHLTLQEIYRILVPGGLLIIREHDLSAPELSVVIDVMHGLYARVWSEPPEQPHFCEDYWARYRRREEWKEICEGIGFRQCKESEDRKEQLWDRGVRQRRDGFIKNPFQYYYGQYEKAMEVDEKRDEKSRAIVEAEVNRKRAREDDEKIQPSIKRHI